MYAQVLKKDMRVNLIGGKEEGLPIEHSSVICVDIGARTDVGLYMTYNPETGEFFDDPGDPPEPTIDDPTIEDYLLDLDFRLSMIELGL